MAIEENINNPIKQYTQLGSINPLKIDEASATLTYIGYALNIGADPASAIWKIKKIEKTGNVTTTSFADGNELFDNIWDNRASLNYL